VVDLWVQANDLERFGAVGFPVEQQLNARGVPAEEGKVGALSVDADTRRITPSGLGGKGTWRHDGRTTRKRQGKAALGLNPGPG
jgi:hypothetical protein